MAERQFFLFVINGLAPHCIGPFTDAEDARVWGEDVLDPHIQRIFFEGALPYRVLPRDSAEAIIFAEDADEPGATDAGYLARFPEAARAFCDIAYQDGYVDGVESERGEVEIDQAAEERHPISDWQYEVANGDTKRGYRDWLCAQIETDAHDAGTPCPDCGGKGAHASSGEDCERCLGGGVVTAETEAYKAGQDPGRVGYRIAENVHANPGFYVRPDDEVSFSPATVYPTAEAAWAAFDAEETSR